MRAALDKGAAVDHKDLRRLAHSGQPMRHHERAALGIALPRTEGALHQLLRGGVERGRRLAGSEYSKQGKCKCECKCKCKCKCECSELSE